MLPRAEISISNMKEQANDERYRKRRKSPQCIIKLLRLTQRLLKMMSRLKKTIANSQSSRTTRTRITWEHVVGTEAKSRTFSTRRKWTASWKVLSNWIRYKKGMPRWKALLLSLSDWRSWLRAQWLVNAWKTDARSTLRCTNPQSQKKAPSFPAKCRWNRRGRSDRTCHPRRFRQSKKRRPRTSTGTTMMVRAKTVKRWMTSRCTQLGCLDVKNLKTPQMACICSILRWITLLLLPGKLFSNNERYFKT